MSIKRLTIDGYGQLELNQVAFRRDGRIEAQAKLDSSINYVENGMLLVLDPVAREVKLPTASTDKVLLNYTTEHMYDPRANALKNFKLDNGTFLPRLGYLATGDKFTSNCIAYDTSEFANDAAVKSALEACGTTAVYGQPCTNGAIQVTATSTNAILKVIAYTTMPDGQVAAKFIAL